MEDTTPTPDPAVAWHEHGAFDDLYAAQWQISRARDALAGIAALLQPDSRGGDEQLNMAHRSDASAVFAFFAEAMQAPLEVVDSAANRLKTALRTGQP